MKRLGALLLPLLVLACLAGQGFAAGEAGYYAIDSVTDGEMSIGREDLVAVGMDWWVRLEADGTAVLFLGEEVAATWGEGVLVLEADGETETIAYTVEDGMLALDAEGERVVFRLGGDEGPAAGDGGPGDGGPGDGAQATPLQAWWAGDWYGYWTVSGTTDRFAALDDGRWDCFARIDLDAAGAGSITVWDGEGMLLAMDITASEDGGAGPMGAAVSEAGAYRDGAAIGRADLIMDPSLYGAEDFLVIDGQYESADDPDEGYFYWVYLRPWGLLWDDVDEEARPPAYEAWYLAHYAGAMPEEGAMDRP